jgi:hypothetical protein
MVDHFPLTAFATINVSNPKVCVDFISRQQYIQILGA